MQKTKIRIDFANPDSCLYSLMITKEYYNENRITWAEVIYTEQTYKSDVVIDPRAVAVNESRLELIR